MAIVQGQPGLYETLSENNAEINSKLIQERAVVNSGRVSGAHTATPSQNRMFVADDCNGSIHLAAPLRLLTKTSVSAASNSGSEISFQPPIEVLDVSSWLSDVGMRPRALGSGSGAVQVGPSGHLHPRLSGKAAFGNCQVAGPCEISRVSGAPAEG